MRTGTGADKTIWEDIPSAEVKAAGGVNLILLQGGCRNKLGYQWCCSTLLCPFNGSPCPWNCNQPKKWGKKKKTRGLGEGCIVIYSCFSFRKGFLIAFRSGVISGLIQDLHPMSDPPLLPGAKSTSPSPSRIIPEEDCKDTWEVFEAKPTDIKKMWENKQMFIWKHKNTQHIKFEDEKRKMYLFLL